jgi:hypothetical protein
MTWLRCGNRSRGRKREQAGNAMMFLVRRSVLAFVTVLTGCDLVYGLGGRTDAAIDARVFPTMGGVEPGFCHERQSALRA